jgi:hypothetical protein
MRTFSSVAYRARGGANRTMMKSILSEIDAEISLLKQVRAILNSGTAVAIKREPVRPPKTAAVVVPNVRKPKVARR